MAKKTKGNKATKNISIKFDEEHSVFNIFIKPIIPFGIRQYSFSHEPEQSKNINPQLAQIKRVKQLLSKEKIRILYTIKENKPKSVYELAKLLKRNFKAVRQDLKVLEDLGLVSLKTEKVKNRLCSRPMLQATRINFSIEF